MTSEEVVVTTSVAPDGAEQPQEQPGQKPGDSPAGQPGAAGTFTAEQQAAVDKVVADRLKRAEAKWKEAQEAKRREAEEAAEAQRLQDEQKWQELARKHEGKANELEGKFRETQALLERANGVVGQLLDERKAGLPEAVAKLLEGRDLYDQLEIVNAFHAAQPAPAAAGGQARPGTPPTPPAQGAAVLTPEERRQRAARIW